MKVLIVSLAKVREAWAQEACALYRKRLQPWLTIDWVEARDAHALPKLIPPRYATWLLDERGKLLTSTQLAAQFNHIRHEHPGWALVLGGPDGFPPAVTAQAATLWSLSPLTFPFQLAHVVVFEQLYRAVSLVHGSPYHRGDASR